MLEELEPEVVTDWRVPELDDEREPFEPEDLRVELDGDDPPPAADELVPSSSDVRFSNSVVPAIVLSFG